MANLLLLNQPYVSTLPGLITGGSVTQDSTFTVQSTGVYTIAFQGTFPAFIGSLNSANLNSPLGGGGAGSGLPGLFIKDGETQPVVTIKQNGSTIATYSLGDSSGGTNSSQTQSALQFSQTFLFTAADVIDIQLVCTGNSDIGVKPNGLNAVKYTVSISNGI